MAKAAANGNGGAASEGKKKVRPPTKGEIYGEIAEVANISKKDVQAVFDALKTLIEKNIKKRDGMFAIPGLLKLTNVRVPPRKARKGKNPRTGDPIEIPAKKAHNAVRVRVLKALREMVT